MKKKNFEKNLEKKWKKNTWKKFHLPWFEILSCLTLDYPRIKYKKKFTPRHGYKKRSITLVWQIHSNCQE